MMRPAVVDASVAIKWFVPEEGTAEAETLAAEGPQLIAPSIIRLEVANAFARKATEGLVTVDHAIDYVRLLPGYIDELVTTDDLLAAAMEMAVALRHPVYDCIYIELARLRRSVMITADKRLLARLGGSAWARFAVSLADWKSVLS